jgi:hypothetical protein
MKMLKSIGLAGTLAVACMELLCVNGNAQTNSNPTNAFANIDWHLAASSFGYKRKTAVDNIPYELMYWNTDTNYTGERHIMGIQMSVVYPARIEVFKMPEHTKIGETNGWYSDAGCDDVSIVRSLLSPPTVQWLGYVMVGKDSIDPYGYPPEPAVVKGAELGLRSDGVVVWRERK